MATAKFSIIPVRGVRHILAMRKIRNQVASYMTHNANQIGVWQQLRWYATTYQAEFDGYLVTKGERVIGYGLIRYKDGKSWVSGGLIPGYRGHGYGERLFRFLTEAALDCWNEEVWLDVQTTNVRAMSLYQKLGYTPTETANGVTVMKLGRAL